ncbi:hypothetical protein KGM_202809A, partial [Danaus plexippus plexippus]
MNSKFHIMEILILFTSIMLIFNVSGFVLNYDDEDQIFDMLLYDYYPPLVFDDMMDTSNDEGQQPIFLNGVWLCGNCSDINEANIIYNESYDVETSNDEMELQIGFAMDRMRCIKIKTDEDSKVARASGACT